MIAPATLRASGRVRFRLVVEFDDEVQAAYLHLFLRRCGFEECHSRTEPHLAKETRTERAYAMVHAVAKVEGALAAAGVPSSIY